MQFVSHGVFTVKATNRRLFVDATGPFNEELAREYRAALESCIQSLEHSPWQQLIVLHKLSLMTPEAETVFVDTLKDRKQRGLLRSAVVVDEGEGRSLVISQFGNAYQKADIEAHFFNSIGEANEWLES
jgi:hypothetical protein